MLEIEVAIDENFDDSTNEFVVAKSVKVRLEHSLVSLSKWEAAWEEAFLKNEPKTSEQSISYVEMMLLDDVPPEIFHKLVKSHLEEIQKYIIAPMTATKLPKEKNKSTSREAITAELIYYWMAELNVPIECQHWHLNRLFTIIQVFNIKKTPPKQMSQADRRKLNRARLAKHGTRG